MSWTQGIQLRDELPEVFVKWADALGKGELQCIVWFDEDRTTFYLDYGERGSIKARLK